MSRMTAGATARQHKVLASVRRVREHARVDGAEAVRRTPVQARRVRTTYSYWAPSAAFRRSI